MVRIKINEPTMLGTKKTGHHRAFVQRLINPDFIDLHLLDRVLKQFGHFRIADLGRKRAFDLLLKGIKQTFIKGLILIVEGLYTAGGEEVFRDHIVPLDLTGLQGLFGLRLRFHQHKGFFQCC